jgi:hypothetical protein
MDRDIVYIIIVLNIIVTIIFYLRSKCEIPLFLSIFNAMVEYRVITLENGTASFVNFNYKIDFIFTLEMAYEISSLILMGSCVIIYSFMLFYRAPSNSIKDSNDTLKLFVLNNKRTIFIGLGLTSLLQLVLSGGDSGSYGFMIKLANSSFIIFFYLLFSYTEFEKTSVKIFYLLGFIFFALLTYSSSLRFQFLGWMIPIGYFMVRKFSPWQKLATAIPVGFIVIVLFSVAGSLRYINPDELSTEELYDEGIERLAVSDDINFIDGFMMMYQVYPRLLDHTYGIEHLNILFRPIPRAIWPGKPLAGWFQNYREKYGVEFANIGFSPTLYGVFYAEGGIEGIILLSVIWGGALVYIYRKLRTYSSELSDILTGILLTSLIPIFRSGDLAGDFAIVLMSYWPIILFIREYNKYLKNMVK